MTITWSSLHLTIKLRNSKSPEDHLLACERQTFLFNVRKLLSLERNRHLYFRTKNVNYLIVFLADVFNTTSLQRQYVTSCLPSVLIFLETERRKKRFNHVDSQGSFRNNKLFLGEALCVYKHQKNLPAAFLVSLSWLGTSDGLVSSMFSRAFILFFCSLSSNSTLKKPAQ